MKTNEVIDMTYKRTKCEECGGRIVTKYVDYAYLGESIGRFEAEVCKKCSETVFDEAISDEIARKVQEKGLYGLEARTTIGIAGSSYVVRINKKLADFLKLRKGERVYIHPENKNRIIIEISN